jgi:uncharacterized protein (DUF488 family)
VASEPEILTVGHSNHEEQDFLELLRGAGVELVADVRANPRSRFPQFNRSALAGTMKAAGIGYAPLGADLGGRRVPGPATVNVGWDIEPFRGYADHMASEEFAGALSRLEALGRSRPAAIMCAEAAWMQCHRRLISDALLVRGWRVRHIGRDGSQAPHEFTPFASVAGDRLTYPAEQTSLDV